MLLFLHVCCLFVPKSSNLHMQFSVLHFMEREGEGEGESFLYGAPAFTFISSKSTARSGTAQTQDFICKYKLYKMYIENQGSDLSLFPFFILLDHYVPFLVPLCWPAPLLVPLACLAVPYGFDHLTQGQLETA